MGLAAVATLGIAGPAQALPNPDEAWSPIDTSQPEPGPADVPVDTHRQQVDDAIREASRMLYAYPGCLNTITGREPGNGEDASTVLSKLNEGRLEGGDGKIIDHPDQPGLLDAPASVPIGTIGTGSNGQIDVYKQFHDDPTADDFYRGLGDNENRPLVDAMFAAFGGPPSPTEWRALILLHELMHLTGNLPGDHIDNFYFEAINSAIFTNCVRAGVNAVGGGGPPADQPQPLPTPTPAPVEGTTGGGGGGDLPTSDDPVIDFGSDDPVVTGADGVPIEGGEIGGAYGDPDPAPDPGDPYCDPFGCVYDDPGGVPYDPGYGGGDYCCGGGGGGDYYPEFDDDWYYYAEEFLY